jgi:hypothetical protein
MEGDPTSDLARAGVVVANRYRLDSVIGRGGMGSVWAATHLGLGHQIAVKLISREFVRAPEALRRFDAEAKAAARLQSRHVVQVYDNGTLDDGTPYIAMELLAGESLQHRIEERGRIDLPEAIDILAGCCKALTRAHAIGIVHRDIKPDNIFLARTADEDRDVAKIIDFGVAKVRHGEGDQGQTGTGMLLGTPLYMSPEQARGLKTLDGRADLYSLGLSAFAMLTGQLAINGESFGDILLKICTQPLPSLRALAPWLPPAMEAWFQRVCAREPADRCQSAQEFIDSLRFAAGQPVATGQSGAMGSVNQFAPAAFGPTMVTAGGAAAASTAGGNFTVTAAGLPNRRTGVVVVGLACGALAIGAVVAIVALRPSAPAASTTPDAHSSAASAASAPPAAVLPPALPSLSPSAPAADVPTAPVNAATGGPSKSGPAHAAPSRPPVEATPASRPSAKPVAAVPAPAPQPAPPPAPAPPAAPAGPPVINLGY